MSLQTYISSERGLAVRLAREISVHPVLVRQWASGVRGVPIEHCAAIERATAGRVTRQELRPADWLRIWPELGDAQSKAA